MNINLNFIKLKPTFVTSLDPCENIKCSFNSLCVVNRNYKASCQCPKCPPTTKYVCGSDGKTYVNECDLRKQSCLTKTNVTVLRDGKCSKFISFFYISFVSISRTYFANVGGAQVQ